jgi:hypothetical protein
MGTRHLILVYYNGKYHIAQYGQLDGYSSGMKVYVFHFARNPVLVDKRRVCTTSILFEPTAEDRKAWKASGNYPKSFSDNAAVNVLGWVAAHADRLPAEGASPDPVLRAGRQFLKRFDRD